jgi:hypothetical protein
MTLAAGSSLGPWITLFLKSDPRMDVLRTDPRCGDLLRRMQLN